MKYSRLHDQTYYYTAAVRCWLSPRRFGFDPRPLHVESVVGAVVFGQVYLRMHQVSSVTALHQIIFTPVRKSAKSNYYLRHVRPSFRMEQLDGVDN